MREVLFIGVGVLTIFCALAVVFARQAASSAFSLVLTFFGLATLYILWGSNFIAMIQILIYAGAIVVLFVFVVMVLDKQKISSLYSANSAFILIALLTVWAVSLLVLRVLNRGTFVEPVTAAYDMTTVANLLFSEYLWAFEILSVFLLSVIIAVCIVAKPDAGEEAAKK